MIRVLIVDDNKDAADLQAAVVRSLGHEAAVEYSALGALQAAPGYGAKLYLLDLKLPDMDGFELVRRLRGIAPSARFVALTGYGPGASGSMADTLFDEYVLKPMTPEMLEGVLARV